MKRIGLIGIILLFVVGVCACSRQEVTNMTPETTTEPVVDVTLSEDVTITEKVQIEETDRTKDYLKNVVRVVTSNQMGSALLWDRNENMVIFVTAAHVVEGNEVAELMLLPGGESIEACVYFVKGLDLAFLQVDAEYVKDTSFDFSAVFEEVNPVESGKRIKATGYNAEGMLLVYEGAVLEPWIYTEDFQSHMLLCECEAVPGMSGGGVFDEKGVCLGIVCGKNDSGQLAVLPASVIESEYHLFINN